MLWKEKINFEIGGKSDFLIFLKNWGVDFFLIFDFFGKIEGDYVCKVVMVFMFL